MVDDEMRVLVVDDDPSLRLLCRVNLELDGYGVCEAATLDAARSEIGRGGVGVVLLDVHVGAASGIDLLDELKRDFAELPVVLLTGESGLPPEARGRADHVLAKPFQLTELTGTVARLLLR
jgi:DNA-binding response OmpR family regulator